MADTESGISFGIVTLQFNYNKFMKNSLRLAGCNIHFNLLYELEIVSMQQLLCG